MWKTPTPLEDIWIQKFRFVLDGPAIRNANRKCAPFFFPDSALQCRQFNSMRTCPVMANVIWNKVLQNTTFLHSSRQRCSGALCKTCPCVVQTLEDFDGDFPGLPFWTKKIHY